MFSSSQPGFIKIPWETTRPALSSVNTRPDARVAEKTQEVRRNRFCFCGKLCPILLYLMFKLKEQSLGSLAWLTLMHPLVSRLIYRIVSELLKLISDLRQDHWPSHKPWGRFRLKYTIPGFTWILCKLCFIRTDFNPSMCSCIYISVQGHMCVHVCQHVYVHEHKDNFGWPQIQKALDRVFYWPGTVEFSCLCLHRTGAASPWPHSWLFMRLLGIGDRSSNFQGECFIDWASPISTTF